MCLRTVLWFSLTLVGSLVAAERPHMLIYLSDDHGMLDCSTYGAQDIPTPFMDRLAAAGLTFTNAYVASPACAPSRGAMLTGLMPARNGAEANHTYPRKDVPVLIHDLKALGYEVAAFGKVTHGKNYTKQCGFDTVNTQNKVKDLRQNVTKYLQGRNRRRPLCLFVGTSNPHVAWPAETRFKPEEVTLPPTFIDTAETRRHRAMYYEEIAELDELLGDLRGLADKHLGSNTLFVYTSDHGGQWPFGKWNLYDAGIRTPFVAAWPGVIAAATKTDAMISWIDLLPTLVELGGGQTDKGLDGISFAEVLRGEKKTHRDRIFTTHSGDGNKNIYPIRALSKGPWKYIWNLYPQYAHTNHSDLLQKEGAGAYWSSWMEAGKKDPAAQAIIDRYFARPAEELYYLPDDPHEQHNLAQAPQHAKIKAALRQELEQWMDDQGDQRKVFNTPRPLDQPETWKPGLVKMD